MYFLYECKHWYKFENDGVERMLSYTSKVVRYILGYMYIGQIAKRRTNSLFAFNMTTRPHTLPDQVNHF